MFSVCYIVQFLFYFFKIIFTDYQRRDGVQGERKIQLQFNVGVGKFLELDMGEQLCCGLDFLEVDIEMDFLYKIFIKDGICERKEVKERLSRERS